MVTEEVCVDVCLKSWAVQTVNAAKSFKVTVGHRQKVFQRVNLRVPRKTIYALLGPSGCGKTSLLRCIAGRLQLDAGQVFVFGQRPGTDGCEIPGRNVGFMPQESAIQGTLTIFESWKYYGALVGVSAQDIDIASKHFIKLLALPPGNTVNSQLSGGQLRRVAFVATVIHRPKLLILDEPTVGIDPISKHRMWQHLERMVNDSGTTIVLTTHYIEEARLAHRIGMMHGETLAEEDETESLLAKYQCTTLEEAFLNVCTRRNGGQCLETTPIVQVAEASYDDQSSTSNFCHSRFCVRSHIVKAILLKNILHFCRIPGALLLIFLIPCLQLSITHFTMDSKFSRLTVDVVNNDLGPLGKQYLAHIDSDILNVILADSEMTANESLRSGTTQAVLTIPKHFSKYTFQTISECPMITRETVLGSRISVFQDGTVPILDHVVNYGLLDALQRFYQSLNNNTSEWRLNSAESAFILLHSTLKELWWPGTSTLTSGALTLGTYYAPTGMAILTLSVEISRGYLEHSFIRGVTTTELILGMFIVLLGILAVQDALELLLGWLFMGFNMNISSFLLAFTTLYVHGAGGISLGLFLSIAITNLHVLLYVAGSILIISGPCTALLWPIEAAPYVARVVFRMLPHFYPRQAITHILYSESKDISVDLLKAFACSLSWMGIFLVLTILLVKRKN